jgi:AcrR family transcriptional regulator
MTPGGSGANGRRSAAKGGRQARRGRPRDDAFDGRIQEAALDELAARGISQFSVSAVARRAGVSKGSIYLRWPDREQLMLGAVGSSISRIVQPQPGSFRKQIAELISDYAALLSEPRALEMNLRVDADRYRHPEMFSKMFERNQRAGNRIIEQTVIDAQHRGEIDPTVPPTVITRILTGSMFVEALARSGDGGVTEEFQSALTDFIASRVELGADGSARRVQPADAPSR